MTAAVYRANGKNELTPPPHFTEETALLLWLNLEWQAKVSNACNSGEQLLEYFGHLRMLAERAYPGWSTDQRLELVRDQHRKKNAYIESFWNHYVIEQQACRILMFNNYNNNWDSFENCPTVKIILTVGRKLSQKL